MRSHVDLELRATSGAVENIKLLQDPRSGVQISLMVSGISDGKHAPGLLSLGTVYTNPYWIPVLSKNFIRSGSGREAESSHHSGRCF